MISDERVDGLARVAYELRARVRRDVPVANGLWLADRMALLGNDYWSLAFVQACATPVDRSWKELTNWVLRHVDGSGDNAVDRVGYREVWSERFFPPRTVT